MWGDDWGAFFWGESVTATVPLAPWLLVSLGFLLGVLAVRAAKSSSARRGLPLVLVALVPLLTVVAADPPPDLVVFENGQRADADEVNANFEALRARIDALESRTDADGDGFTPAEGDCNDSDPAVFPGAAEVCDGVDNDCDSTIDGIAATCPTEAGACGTHVCLAGQCVAQPRASGTVCRMSAGPCDVAETCDGVSTTCPADGLRPGGFVCRAATGDCDVPETCSGASPACPSNQFRPASFVCRAAVSACDATEPCSGASGTCPADGFLPNGASCAFGAGSGVCQFGSCVPDCGGPGQPDCP